MTLSEAARTGRKFRRTSEPDYWYRLVGRTVVQFHPTGAGIEVHIDAEQIVATDWEAEAQKIQITAQDLIDCARSIAKTNQVITSRKLSATEWAKLFIEELGFEEGLKCEKI